MRVRSGAIGLQRFPVACSGARSVWSAARPDTTGEFGAGYGTGSGRDLVDSEVVDCKAPGRYRSLYRTNSPAVSVLAALVFTQRKAARTRRTPNAPRRRAAYPFRKGCNRPVRGIIRPGNVRE